MQIQQLDEQVSVSEQITTTDIPGLVEDGVVVLVCNRPDGEAFDQTPFAEIQAAALEQGLEVHNIPFPGDAMTSEHARQFAELMATGKRIHAYCRSGTRSGNLWASAKQLSS